MADYEFVLTQLVELAARNAACSRIYAETPPNNPTFPYVTIGRTEPIAGGHLATTFHVWTRHGGRAEAHTIISALRESIAGKPISMSAGAEGEIEVQFSDVFRSGDGRTTHGVLRVRCFIAETKALPATEPTHIGTQET